MDAFRRIFGLGPKKQALPEPVTIFEREDGTARVRMIPDASAGAALARNALVNILGADNLPPGFGMQPMIEVKGADGKYVPVSGSKGIQPDMQTQMAYLQSFQETGIVGPQPVNPDGSMAAQTGGMETQVQPGQTGAAAPMLTFGPMPMMPQGGFPFIMGGQAQLPYSMGMVQGEARPDTKVKAGKGAGPAGTTPPTQQQALPQVLPFGIPQGPQMGLIDPMMTANIVRQMFPTTMGGVLPIAPTAQFGGGK